MAQSQVTITLINYDLINKIVKTKKGNIYVIYCHWFLQVF